jgi:hypothetical protein
VFISKLSGNEVKPAQYLVELMAERKAKKDGKRIEAGFWRDDYWQEFYVQTIQAANSLLKLYSAEVIVAALKDKRATWMYSLRASKQLKPILAEYEKKEQIQAKIEKEKQAQIESPKPIESLEVQKEGLRPQVPVKKPSIASKLRNL